MNLDELNFAVAFVSLVVAAVALIRQRRASDRVSRLEATGARQKLRDRRVEATHLQADLLFRTNALLFKYERLAERAASLSTSLESPLPTDLLSIKSILDSRVTDLTRGGVDAQRALSILSNHEQLKDKDLEHFDRTCAALRMANSALEKNATDAMIDEFARLLAQFEAKAA
jgi:hypothetical protein